MPPRLKSKRSMRRSSSRRRTIHRNRYRSTDRRDDYRGVKDGRNGSWLYWSGKRWHFGVPNFVAQLSAEDIKLIDSAIYSSHGRGGGLYELMQRYGVTPKSCDDTGLKCEAEFSGRQVTYMFLRNPVNPPQS